MLCSACMLLYCLLWRRVRSRQSNAGTLPRTNYGSWPIFATLLSIGSNTLHQFLKHFTLLRCACYTSSIYMTATKNQNRTTLLSSRPKDKATRSGVDGEFAKTLFRQKSSWAFSRLLGIISHILPDQLSAALQLGIPAHWRKIWESSNCQMVQMADNLSSQVNLGRLSISECLSTCILGVTLVGRVMVGSGGYCWWSEWGTWEKVALVLSKNPPTRIFRVLQLVKVSSGSLQWSCGRGRRKW